MKDESAQDNAQSPRRKFLQTAAMGMAIASTTHVTMASAAQESLKAKNQARDIEMDIDVLVVGGGTAGTIAGIQAGRLGMKTLIVERGAQLGGQTTTGGVAFPGLFDAWGKQIISGIGWELVKESVELDGGTLPDFRKVPKRHWHNQVQVNQFIYVLLAEEKCAEAGVQIAYHEFPDQIRKTADGYEVEMLGFGTRRKVKCKQIIDCSGGAELVGMLGYDRLREEETQPGSYLYQLGSSYDPQKNLHRLYVHGADSSNSRTVTEANLTGRKTILEKVRKSKGKKRLMHLQPETGFRESYRIVGETFITVNDYTSGRHFDDSITYAFYPVDLHTKNGVKPKPLKRGVLPRIPLGALIPKGSTNLMVAGRSLSSDRLANSALRVQAPCMAMGQAAAVTASLAIKQKTTPWKVSLSEIKSELESQGAIVPERG